MREASSWPPGRVLDVASGDGRNALWLATRGFAVTAIDISASAVAAVQSTAAARAVAIATRVADLDMPRPLAGLGPFDAAVVIRYRPSAPQWAAIIATLAPGGQVLLCSFGRAQHERHGFPLAFCVERHAMLAELGTLAAAGAMVEPPAGCRLPGRLGLVEARKLIRRGRAYCSIGSMPALGLQILASSSASSACSLWPACAGVQGEGMSRPASWVTRSQISSASGLLRQDRDIGHHARHPRDRRYGSGRRTRRP